MAKGETKKTNEMLEKQRGQMQSTYLPIIGAQGARADTAYGQSQDIYGQLMKGYGDMAAGTSLNGAGGAGGGGGVSYQAPQYQSTNYAPVRGTYEEFQGTGGIDLAAMRKANPTFEKLMDNGGLSADDMSRMRGSGVFDEFAKTGGVSDADKANLRSRGASQVASSYGGMKEEMQRQKRISGGNASMGNAAALRMARDQSRTSADTALGTELGISDAVRSGRQWGAGSLSSAEQQLQGLRTGNMLGAGQALANVEESGQRLTQGGRMWGTEGVRGIEENIAAEVNRQREANASAANASASSRAAAEQDRDRLRAAGLSGLSDLRGQELGAYGMYNDTALQGAGSLYGMGNEQLGLRYNAQGNNTSGWDKALGAAVGVGGAFLTGGASLAAPAIMGALKKKPTTPMGAG